MSRLGGSCSPTSTELGQHRPSPFTIDAILSEDIGPRKPSSSPIVENPPCRPPWSPLNALLKTPPAKNGTASQRELCVCVCVCVCVFVCVCVCDSVAVVQVCVIVWS